MNRDEVFPFFRELTARGTAELTALAENKAPPRRTLLSRGVPCGGAYLVLRGALRVFYFTEDGREATLYRVKPGETCVLALSSTIHERPYPAWVQTEQAGAGFVRIPPPSFQRLTEQEPAFRRFVMEAMGERIFELMTALEQLATRTIKQRVAAYLAEHEAHGEVRVTQEALASELGTAREVIFRALATLSDRKLIAKHRGRIRILDAARLAKAASGRGLLK